MVRMNLRTAKVPKDCRALLLILLTMAAAYSPLLLQIFSLRNDQISYFLPVRMYMSDAFDQGEFLLWNPYFGGSYPLHCDMQGPVWNPIAMLLSWLLDYNATLLSFEFFLYYFIGAAGAFYLASNFTTNIKSRITIAVCYGCGGFAASTLEFMSWVGSIAFLPWVAHFIYRIFKGEGFYISIKLALSLWLLLVCGYPSFFILMGYACIFLLTTYAIKLVSTGNGRKALSIIKWLSLAFVFFVLLALPAIQSYAEYLPYYARGKSAAAMHINAESFSWVYPISLVFPGSFTGVFESQRIADHWHVSTYIGLVPFLALLVNYKKVLGGGFKNRFLQVACLWLFLFSIGRSTPLRMWCAQYVPLLGTFGFSHSVRVFIVLAAFVWLAPALKKIFEDVSAREIKSIKATALLAGMVLAAMLYIGLFKAAFNTRLYQYFYFVGLSWQLLLVATVLISPPRFFKAKYLFGFILIDLAVSTLSLTPLTGLSKNKPSVYNQYAHEFYQLDAATWLMHPELKTPEMMITDSTREVNANKLIPSNGFASNTRSEAYMQYVSDKDRRETLVKLPFAFSADSTPVNITQLDLNYNSIHISAEAANNCMLVLQQTFYTRWHNANGIPLSPHEGVFLQVPLQKGPNKIDLYYKKTDFLIEASISVAMLLFAIAILLLKKRGGFNINKSPLPAQGI